MHVHAFMCTQLLVQFKFFLLSLGARSINLVCLIKAFKAQSYENILYITVLGMLLAVGSIYLPCHLVSLLKSQGTATFGFLEIFNNGQANNVFLYQSFPSLALPRGVLQGQLHHAAACVLVDIVIAAFVPFLTNRIIAVATDH